MLGASTSIEQLFSIVRCQASFNQDFTLVVFKECIIAAKSMQQDNINIKHVFKIEVIYNLELNRKATIKELTQQVKEVKRAIEYTYISNTNKHLLKDIEGNLRRP